MEEKDQPEKSIQDICEEVGLGDCRIVRESDTFAPEIEFQE